MAIAYVQEIGKNAAEAGAAVAVTVANAPSAGSLLIARLVMYGTNPTQSGVPTDSRSNTWRTDIAYPSGNYRSAICATGQTLPRFRRATSSPFPFLCFVRAVVVIDEFTGQTVAGTDENGVLVCVHNKPERQSAPPPLPG